jgi:hypothetical protein
MFFQLNIQYEYCKTLILHKTHPDALRTAVQISSLRFILFFLIAAHKFMKTLMNNSIIFDMKIL